MIGRQIPYKRTNQTSERVFADEHTSPKEPKRPKDDRVPDTSFLSARHRQALCNPISCVADMLEFRLCC